MDQGKGQGKFGSVHGDNEAQMEFIVASSKGPPMVLLDFMRQCDHIHLTPREARELAGGLNEAANEAEVGSSLIMAKRLNGA